MVDHRPAGIREVALITRTRTPNKGNQALSRAWEGILHEAFAGTDVRLLERVPNHLLRYSLRKIAAEADPVAALERIADELVALAPGADLVPPPGANAVVLDEKLGPPRWFAAARQRWRPRSLLTRLGFDRPSYLRRLAALRRASVVLVNPAGEFYAGATDLVVRYLLDVLVAKKLGARCGVVNLSLEVEDERLFPLVVSVFDRMDLLQFRDEESVERLARMGGDTSRVFVVPDLAILTPSPPRRERTGRVAVAINAVRAAALGHEERWAAIIDALRARYAEVVLVSNEVPTDLPLYRRLCARSGVRVEGEGLDYLAFAELLAGYEVVVTSRLHTAILALAAGAPVVPVESGSFKILGLFKELGFDAPAIEAKGDGWGDAVVARVAEVTASRDAHVAEIARRMELGRERIRREVLPRLQALAPDLR